MKNRISLQSLVIALSVIIVSGFAGFFTTHQSDRSDSGITQENDPNDESLNNRELQRSSAANDRRPKSRLIDRQIKRMTRENLEGLDALSRAEIIAAGVAGLESRESFEAALEQFRGLSGLERDFALNLLFAQWAKTDPALAMENVMGNERLFKAYGGNLPARMAVMRAWTQSDPLAASDYLMKNGDDVNFFRSKLAEMAAEGLARVDPEKAIKWALTFDAKDSSLNGASVKTVFKVIVEDSPERAISVFGDTFPEIKEKQARLALVRLLAAELTPKGSGLLDQFLASIPDTEDRTMEGFTLSEAAKVESIYALMDTDVEGALRRYTEIRRDQENLRPYRLSTMLVRADLDRAKSWVDGLEMDEGFSQAIVPVMGELSARDPDQAYDYLSTFTDQNKRKAAIATYLQSRSIKDFRRSAELCKEVADNYIGITAKEGFLTRWYLAEPENAANFINQELNASPELEARLNKLFAEEEN